MRGTPKLDDATEDAAPQQAEPVHAAGEWREHDIVIRRFHLGGLAPTEIAVVFSRCES